MISNFSLPRGEDRWGQGRYQSYLNTAQKIIAAYKGEEPLANYLKKFFAADKKYGSKDRKQISSLCYNYYRLGKALPEKAVDEKIILANFLCEQMPNAFLQAFSDNWNEKITLSLKEKIALSGLNIKDVFPFINELSAAVDGETFQLSFFQQPDLFLRIRPGKKDIVENKLAAAGISYQLVADDCIALPNSSKINEIIELDKEAVVQDMNSQKVLNNLPSQITNHKAGRLSWDCCAASGGKSILLYDKLNGQLQLTVSDIRESILSNLKKRFFAAGIKKYSSFIADLGKENAVIKIDAQQLIVCDAPCTGSGTWARTPEQLFYFDKAQIKMYADRQKQIASNVIPHLAAGGIFVYITCSVFKQENEEVVNFIKEKFHLQLLQMELLSAPKADNMFVAIFKNERIKE
jgi:16S rRNA (cytosine967-C5)-methyltransferase